MSQQYSCASLVKIHPFLHDIGCRQAIFQQSKPLCDLENGSRSPKFNQLFSCHNNIDVQVWSKSIHSFRRQGADKPISNNLSPMWVWIWSQGHQNIISSFACPINIAVQVWSKSTYSFRRLGADKPFSNNLSLSVTLKMGSRSPKSNQFFSMSQQYRCTSLVKIHPFIQEIGCRQAIFQQSKPSCDLENGVKVTKM